MLLIDADLRRPRLHEMFGGQKGPGLTDVLLGKSSQIAAFRKTNVSRLWLMPAGQRHCSNPADLLGLRGVCVADSSLTKQVDWVVLDSPPVLAVADPCVISRVASGVSVRARFGSNFTRGGQCAAIERLDAVGAQSVGAMLNRAELDKHTDSYLPYYHRGSEGYDSASNDTAARRRQVR